MAVKLKVSDVAKDFALSGKEIAELLEPYCGELKKSSNSLNEDELDIIFELLTKKYAVKSFDNYFKMGEEAKEKRKKEKEAEKQRKLLEQAAILEQFKAAAAAELAAKKQPKEVKPEEAVTIEKAEPKKAEPKKAEVKAEPKKENKPFQNCFFPV